jgi:hypothetical protein
MPSTSLNVRQATRNYEDWMRSCTTIIESHLQYKHERMRDDLFMFFRGTYYRWAQVWPEVCADVFRAPKVLAIGDLHLGSFGTWRDGEGRLAWGVDDFDESYPLPYTNDLVRLAASLKMVTDSEDNLTIKFKDGCEAILNGYEDALKSGGRPFVLAEQQHNLEKLGIDAIKPPVDFWEKLCSRPAVNGLPRDAKQAIEKTLPDKVHGYKVVRRKAGLGSLGQQRFVAVAECQGGYVAREAKAMVPSASVWLRSQVSHCQSYYERAIKSAVRSHDPYQRIVGSWLIRRLSPDANPIEISDIPKQRDEEVLLQAMGAEAANVHLGSNGQAKTILADLHRRKSKWLRSAAKDMAKAMEEDWKEYRMHRN